MDLDIEKYYDSVNHIYERLKYLDDIKLLPKILIKRIVLIQKKNFSCKIYLKKEAKTPVHLILFQSIIGEDFKRTALTLRDFECGLRNFNRMFDLKRYPDGEYISSQNLDITKKILNKFPVKNNKK
ncbi:MAG: hypothetical protein ACTSRG_23925 [Candidatus Helarchaeota archaeon]